MNYHLTQKQVKLIQDSLEFYVEHLQWSSVFDGGDIPNKIESLLEINRVLMNQPSQEIVELDYPHLLCDY